MSPQLECMSSSEFWVESYLTLSEPGVSTDGSQYVHPAPVLSQNGKAP